MTERLHFHFSLSCIGEGNGNPLQCSCLENPRDGGAWWAAVYGVAQSRTRLKWLSSSSSRHITTCHILICNTISESRIFHVNIQYFQQVIDNENIIHFQSHSSATTAINQMIIFGGPLFELSFLSILMLLSHYIHYCGFILGLSTHQICSSRLTWQFWF